ncbi:AraC family transcriptional regulator [Polyangium sp. 15x6]|uniref:AraC family transcriptional regulator n=1 Tax=Polyangium sp. 15x6 TaxID=3042687 RepID=UPI002499F216|nr:AraC family transcriptional regulator [Polyangium sp. 15x6]
MPARALVRPMRSQIVGPILSRLRGLGVDPSPLVEAFGLPPGAETEPDVVLPLAKLYAFLDEAARVASDPFLGVHLAAQLERGTYDLLEFSCLSAPTVREALVRVARYTALLNDLVVATFEERGGVGLLQQRIPGAPLCLGRHANECFVVLVLLRTRALSGVSVVPERAWFGHPAPRDTSALAEALGTPRLEFDAGATGLALPGDALVLPLATSDPRLLSVLDRHAERSRVARERPHDFFGEVRQRVFEKLRDGAPDLEVVARALSMSPRTLQRRLTEEGTTFQELVDGLRREMAGAYVRDTEMPLAEIAVVLGYRETGAFLRAFKRWYGVAASQMRGARARSGAP